MSSTHSYLVHPLNVRISESSDFWLNKQPDLQCWSCGEFCNKSPPFTVPLSLDQSDGTNRVSMVGRGIYCSIPCLYHGARSYEINPNHYTTCTTDMLASLYDHWPDVDSKFRYPSVLSLCKFGGDIQLQTYRSAVPKFDKSHCSNPYQEFIFNPEDEIWRTRLQKSSSGTNLCCYYCLQYLFDDDKPPITVPIHHDKVRDLYTVRGLFHSGGGCALAYILQEKSQFSELQVYWLSNMMRKYFGGLDKLRIAPSKYLLKCFGGPLSTEEFRSGDTNMIVVREPPYQNYPYFSQFDSTVGMYKIETGNVAIQPTDTAKPKLVQAVFNRIGKCSAAVIGHVQFNLMVIDMQHNNVVYEQLVYAGVNEKKIGKLNMNKEQTDRLITSVSIKSTAAVNSLLPSYSLVQPPVVQSNLLRQYMQAAQSSN
jgi:hypothetical protein